jgi:phospholipase C
MPDLIEHVVVLMLENHSFDQMLGGMTAEVPALDGADPTAPRGNADDAGQVYFQAPTSAPVIRRPDPKHETVNVLAQLANTNGGFVLDYCTHPITTPSQRQQIMSYYPAGALPALHELARHFTACDARFSSVPGPTWTNRFFVHSGTSLGRVRMPGGVLSKGDTWLAVYERKGDDLKWCGGYVGQNLARPTTFTTKPGDGGYFARSLKREKK